MADAHPLDSPIRSALTGAQAEWAVGVGKALRFQPGLAVFACGPLEDVARLPQPEGGLLMMEATRPPVPPGQPARERMGAQMVLEALSPGGHDPNVLPLGEADAADMRVLARLTEPGPFFSRTWSLGAFIGLRREGRLIAMAGERMRADGFTELSGVCTHPDHRGQGLGAALIRLKCEAIRARGETPFLHAWADNAAALALYQSLGFRLRTRLHVLIVGEPDLFAEV